MTYPIRHYLDYNATAPFRPEVLELVHEWEGVPLNPSSVHRLGRKAKSLLTGARKTIAEALSAFPHEIIFTSCATEANNWLIHSYAQQKLVISAIEHSSVRVPATQAHAITLPVTSDGVIDLEQLDTLLPKEAGFLVSVMLANNETGAIQPVKEIATLVHKNGGLMHTDAVQALGKIPIDFTNLGVDFMTISAHKMGGPLGASALIVKSGITLPAYLKGGTQEERRRAGTENIHAIIGFAKAVEYIDFAQMQQLRMWLDAFEANAEQKNGVIFSKNAPRLPTTCMIAHPTAPAETQLIRLDLDGISVSAGAACSSGRVEPSHVPHAMKMDGDISTRAIRISGGWGTTERDIMTLTHTWNAMAL